MNTLLKCLLVFTILLVGCSKSEVEQEQTTTADFTIDSAAYYQKADAKHDNALEGIYKGTLGNTQTGFHEIVVVNIKNKSDKIFAFITKKDQKPMTLKGNWNEALSSYEFKNQHGSFSLEVSEKKVVSKFNGHYYGAEMSGSLAKETSSRGIIPTMGSFSSTSGPMVSGFFDLYWAPEGEDIYGIIGLYIDDGTYQTFNPLSNADPDVSANYERVCGLTLGGGTETLFIIDAAGLVMRDVGEPGGFEQLLTFYFISFNSEFGTTDCATGLSGPIDVLDQNWNSPSGGGSIEMDWSTLPGFPDSITSE